MAAAGSMVSSAPGRSALAWVMAAWASFVLLPWYKVEGGFLSFDWLAQPTDATPAIILALGGRPWLLPLVLPLLLASWLVARNKPKSLAIAGAAGLLWLAIEGFSIIHSGWGFGLLTQVAGTPGPIQPGLGWGAALYAVAMLMFIAEALAARGWCKGDRFVVGSLSIVIASLILFVAYPLLSILTSAIKDNDGNVVPALFVEKIFSANIWSLRCLYGEGSCGVAWNTVAIAVLVGFFCTALGLALALIALRTKLPAKWLLRGLSILPIITPPFVIGLALILLFGRAGIVTNLMSVHLGIPRSRWIYGMAGITIAQVLAFTPIAFLVLVGVLQGVSPSMEEASQTLRASRWRTFRTVTWPLIRPGLASAFLISFIESMADFANPLVLGGNFNVLSTDIFFAVVGAAHDQGRAAVLAIVLLMFTLAAFVIQRRWIGSRSYVTVAGKGDGGVPATLPKALRIGCYAAVVPWLVLTIVVYGIILCGGFVQSIGRDNTPTLEYFLTAFSIEKGVNGWFFSGSAWPSLLMTIGLALVAMPFTAALGILTAYLLDRQRFAGRTMFEFLAMMSFAIPGTVIGVSYILAFNVPPVQLTGTGLIIVISFIFRNMPVAIRAGLANLGQIDKSLDEASLTLGARSFATLRRVILPILKPAIVTAMIYSFVRAVTAVSAVIFLASGRFNLATVYIVGRADVGEYGIAIVYSAVMIVVMMVILIGIQLLVGERRLGRRRAGPEAVVAAI
ncbi:iron ABC transporter permease [Mesorhizobium sp. M1148]|uniref:ABC transporter permease n=2 Tax=Mesorhizobium TaxID=68287 RepID=UPI0003CE1507|nr:MULTISPECIES: iron ABC transporter permease [unclassified Mesorhizobium]ESX33653.1 iron ABC transporter permease [Mesorhizobium sp. LSHC432A00]ESX15444.1 iron ABC transporter permease [Mesorhizobium sp. LSJC255A00]ESX25522.1 iron ABC transporter permease [Mesorhizobium sp. LSHC440B00]ESX44825.1 iron ABC transporter permease [Mesorhizobium sp. LSHC440A00]ESX69633.1 iron ABC transporter permease [Mesorhizobium sp. LSHC414A00]